MGYRIEYQRIKKLRHTAILRSRFLSLWAIIFTVFLISVYAFWPEGWNVIESILFPAVSTASIWLDSVSNAVQNGVTSQEILDVFGFVW